MEVIYIPQNGAVIGLFMEEKRKKRQGRVVRSESAYDTASGVKDVSEFVVMFCDAERLSGVCVAQHQSMSETLRSWVAAINPSCTNQLTCFTISPPRQCAAKTMGLFT